MDITNFLKTLEKFPSTTRRNPRRGHDPDVQQFLEFEKRRWHLTRAVERREDGFQMGAVPDPSP
jgi:hypothetical protein